MKSWSQRNVSDTLDGVLHEMKTHGTAITPGFDPEALHQFRVGVKRLRALLRLLEAANRKSGMKLPGSFRELYRLAGCVRDAQVLLARATTEADPPLPEYTVWLAQGMADAQAEFDAHYSGKIFKKLEKAAKKISVPEIRFEVLHTFFKDRLDEIQRILESDTLEDEDLHTARKRVKDLQHIAKICADAWPEGLEALGPMASIEALEAVADEAGDYNDEAVAVRSIEEYLRVAEKPKKPEKVLAAWEALKDRNREGLLGSINRFRTGNWKSGRVSR